MHRALCGVLFVLGVAPPVFLIASTCPPGCCCPHPGSLVLCESLGLQSLPRSVPLSTSALSVAHNRLCDVDHLLWPFSGLQELSLGHNRLPRFPRGLPPSLQSLQLRENRITYLTAGGLQQLSNLTRLDLEDNRIRFIQPGALLGLKKLQVLSLKGNQLSGVPQSLPPSLIHLDLSANCVSTLDLASLATLVNLQVLKVNSNCLKSVPMGAFDGLPRLRVVALADNLWVCECNILYLYAWLLDGRLRMATDLACAAPVHLAHHLLLTLSVAAICPRVLKPNNTRDPLDTSTMSGRQLQSHIVQPAVQVTLAMKRVLPTTPKPALPSVRQTIPETPTVTPSWKTHEDHTDVVFIPKLYVLDGLSYKECLSNSTPGPMSPTDFTVPHQHSTCAYNSTGCYAEADSPGPGPASPVQPTEKVGPQPSTHLWPARFQESNAIVSVLAVLCVLVAVVLLVVLILLKKVLRRNQRVGPIQQS